MDEKNIDEKLNEALKNELDFTLPDSFTDELLLKIDSANKKSDRNLYWLLFASGMFMLITSIITVIMYTNIDTLIYVSQYGSWGLFITGLIVLVQFLDRKLLKEKLGASKLT